MLTVSLRYILNYMAKYLSELHAKKLFNLEDITSLTDNINTGKNLLLNYKKQNLIKTVSNILCK